MSRVAMRNGVNGTIADGIIRDIPDIREMKYPTFARASCMDRKDALFLSGSNTGSCKNRRC